MAKAKELDIIMHYFIFAHFELNTSDFVDSSKSLSLLRMQMPVILFLER